VIDPAVAGGDGRSALAARFRESGNLRVRPFFEDTVAGALVEALKVQPFTLTLPEAGSPFDFQYWKFTLAPEAACDHVLCRCARWLDGDFVPWVEAVTGLELEPPPESTLAASLYVKGSYLDAHNDWGKGRAVAYVIGLTRGGLPENAGGALEFLDSSSGVPGAPCERRAAEWNTLDLFDVRAPARWHRVPIVREHVERWAIYGWLYPRGARR
jgi:hypothetical protein